MTKRFCAFGKRKNRKESLCFSTKSQALTALGGLLQVPVLLQLCLPRLLTNTFKLIPTLPTQKDPELLEKGLKESVTDSAIKKEKEKATYPASFSLF